MDVGQGVHVGAVVGVGLGVLVGDDTAIIAGELVAGWRVAGRVGDWVATGAGWVNVASGMGRVAGLGREATVTASHKTASPQATERPISSVERTMSRGRPIIV